MVSFFICSELPDGVPGVLRPKVSDPEPRDLGQEGPFHALPKSCGVGQAFRLELSSCR